MISAGACVAMALGTGTGMVVTAGCSSTPTPVDYARSYPERPNRGVTLDIQVFRGASHLELTNTTARAFGASTLWLNGWFSRPIDGLAVGQTLRLPLREFRDEYSYAFRGGGFFATEKPERLASVELETDSDDGRVFYRLIVVGGEGK